VKSQTATVEYSVTVADRWFLKYVDSRTSNLKEMFTQMSWILRMNQSSEILFNPQFCVKS
jgi:hypothetical protein